MVRVQDTTETYFGAGQVFIAERNSLGKPEGFTFVGNVSKLDLSFKVDQVKHIEKQSCLNAVDEVLEKGLEVEVSYSTCSFYKDNIARFMFGLITDSTGGVSITDEELTAYLGKTAGLDRINLDAFVSLTDATGATTYVEGVDYDLDLPMGRVDFLDTATFAEGDSLRANYTAGIEEAIAAFGTHNKDYYLRFEGLNCAQNESPVVIDIPKLRLAPLDSLSIISDNEYNKFEQKGMALYDSKIVANGKYSNFVTIRKVAN